MRRIASHAFTACGFLALGIGLLGIVLPLLPTTPFVLLAAACFLRGSARFHRWLVEHPLLGCHVRDFESGRGVPARVKAVALLLLWFSVTASALLMLWRIGFGPLWLSVASVLLGCAIFATWYLTRRLPTRSECADTPHSAERSEAGEAQVQ